MKQQPSLSASVWQLLRRNISAGQLAGYAVANVVGLGIILTALMFYADATTEAGSDRKADPYFSSSFEVINKRVEGIGLTPVAFTEAEIDSIKSQPWARRVGKFTSSRFTVDAALDMGGRGISSSLFMEAIPDEFFDIRPRDWEFNPADPFIPLVLSRDYLALYNFGFAAPQGLPQLSEDVVATVPIALRLRGSSGRDATMKGGIVGFSSRLNTIAVPQSFMDWANERFAPGEPPMPPSRLIVETDPSLAAGKSEWLHSHGMQSSADSSDASAGRLARFSAVASGVVSGIGGVISLMAVFILFLSIWLILQKSRDRLSQLMLLGYSPRDAGLPLQRLVAGINLAVAALALAAMFAARSAWSPSLALLDLGGASLLPVLSVAAGFAIIVTAANVITIRRHLTRLWHDR